MNAKNLPLKFGILAIVVIISLWSLFMGDGLRQGIDLKGGHSLIYEIKRQEGDASDLPTQMTNTLKERIDPEGLLSLEWRPLGNNRIEVRMPAGKTETVDAKNAYINALETLEAGNIQRSEIRLVLQSPADKYKDVISSLAGDDADLAARFEALYGANQKIAAAATEDEKDKAIIEYETVLEGLLKTNISPQRFQAVLANYVSSAQESVLAKKGTKGDKQIDARRIRYSQGIKGLKKDYPAREAEIENIVTLHKSWIDTRSGLDDPSDLKRLIAKAGVLEFRIAPRNPMISGSILTAEEYKKYRSLFWRTLETEGPEGLLNRTDEYMWFPVHGDEGEKYGGLVTGVDAGGQIYILLANKPNYAMLQETGKLSWQLKDARPGQDSTGLPAVNFEFNEAGARRFAELTGANLQRQLATMLDDEMYSAPVIQSLISSKGQITGDFDMQEVKELCRILKAGSLPAKLNIDPVSENTFGPSIGAVNREMGIKAAYYGLIGVAVFMLVYYLLSGFIANVALMLNIILILGAMSLLQAVFTLPGIAGVILTIGIAVDANVLIFERLREEQLKGQTVRMALKNAYQKAFSAIFDANLTTLIVCLILGWVGTEEVRGFAITLGLGVVFSMFTALVVTRWIFQLLLDTGIVKKPLFIMHIIGVPKINWMSKRYIFWALSAAMLALGIVSLSWQGKKILGIEFSSGTQAIVQFNDGALIDGKLPNDALVRSGFKAKAEEKGVGYEALAAARVETRIDPNRVRNFLRDHDVDQDGRIELSEWQQQKLNPEFFKVLVGEDEALTREILVDRLTSVSYQISTTETQVSLIREVAGETFGNSLVQKVPCKFELAKGKIIEQLGIMTASDGRTKITSRQMAQVNPVYRDEFVDFEDGLLLTVEKVSPAISRTDMVQRLRQMRFQPDFTGQMLNPAEVIGLTLAGEDAYSSFAVLIRPADAAIVEKPEAWDAFVENEAALVAAALEREEAMVASNFDAEIAGEGADKAILAIVLSWFAIVAYLWLRFGSAQWGLAAVICLIHDVIIVIGLIAVSGWLHDHVIGKYLGIESFKIDLAMVAAFLTVIGYSVNDTIVVFDRIRENRGKLETVSHQVINTSINQTLSRTLLTSGTTLIVVVIMYVWGGPGIHAFAYALLAGILVGTYSSIAIASPLLMGFKKALVAKTVTSKE